MTSLLIDAAGTMKMDVMAGRMEGTIATALTETEGGLVLVIVMSMMIREIPGIPDIGIRIIQMKLTDVVVVALIAVTVAARAIAVMKMSMWCRRRGLPGSTTFLAFSSSSSSSSKGDLTVVPRRILTATTATPTLLHREDFPTEQGASLVDQQQALTIAVTTVPDTVVAAAAVEAAQ